MAHTPPNYGAPSVAAAAAAAQHSDAYDRVYLYPSTLAVRTNYECAVAHVFRGETKQKTTPNKTHYASVRASVDRLQVRKSVCRKSSRVWAGVQASPQHGAAMTRLLNVLYGTENEREGAVARVSAAFGDFASHGFYYWARCCCCYCVHNNAHTPWPS